MYIWNVSTEEPLVEMKFPDIVLSACFNYNGSRLVTTCKDRRTRVVNPRDGKVIVVCFFLLYLLYLVCFNDSVSFI